MPSDYILEYIPKNYYKRDRIRKIVLGLAVIIDILAILMLGSAIIVPIYWIIVICLIVASNSARLCVNLLPKKYRYGIKNGKFEIVEITPLKSRKITSSEVNNVTLDRYESNLSDINDITLKLTDNSCQLMPYMVKLNEKQFLIEIDEYMYCLIDSMQHLIGR